MRNRILHVLLLLGALAAGPLSAEELRLRVEGGDQLSVHAVAQQQQWITHGEKIWVAAVANGKLVVQEVSLRVSPQPGPGPQPEPEPGPQPGPQPGPAPKTVIWIEESGQRTPQQAAALTDRKLRETIASSGWMLRVADVDVVDESGRPPSDLAPYLERARQAGLPWLVILEDGRELYTGKAPPDLSAFVALLRRYGLPIGGVVKDEGPAAAAVPPADDAPPKTDQQASPGNCPTGQCPTQVPVRRWRILR